MPQALRTVVQPLGSIFIALIKNSALVTIISVPNLTKTGEAIGTDTAQFIPALLGAAVAYLCSPSRPGPRSAGSSARSRSAGEDRR